jgi:alkylation response protein AidB-like acyl-CoA dehydrogenase
MHWELSEEQELFADSFGDWLHERASTETLRKWLEVGDRSSFQQSLRNEGWAGVGFDEAIGGEGGGLLELALTARELGRHASPSAAWLQTAIVAPALSGEPELLSGAIGGESQLVLTAPADRIPHVTSVRCEGDLLSGRVPSVLAAEDATHLLVPVRDGHDVALWLVDARSERVNVAPRALLDRSRDAADVDFERVVGRRIEVEDAEQALNEIASRAAVLVAADALGAAARMLTLTVDYSKQRKQFGSPIGAFQAVKHAAAEMLVDVESSTSIVFYAAQSVQEQLPDRAMHAAVAKAQVTGRAAGLADTALTLHGAIGYTWEHDLQLFYKRAKLDRVLFGTPTAWNDRIADALPLITAGN